MGEGLGEWGGVEFGLDGEEGLRGDAEVCAEF